MVFDHVKSLYYLRHDYGSVRLLVCSIQHSEYKFQLAGKCFLAQPAVHEFSCLRVILARSGMGDELDRWGAGKSMQVSVLHYDGRGVGATPVAKNRRTLSGSATREVG